MESKTFAELSLDEIIIYDDKPTTTAPTKTPQPPQQNPTTDFQKDTGILEFMTIEKAAELYKKISTEGIPKLEWKFYGRKKPGEKSEEEMREEETKTEEAKEPDEDINTGFDFDEDFGDPDFDLQLKKRPELKTDRTNLNDIMSDLLKETTTSTGKSDEPLPTKTEELTKTEKPKVSEKSENSPVVPETEKVDPEPMAIDTTDAEAIKSEVTAPELTTTETMTIENTVAAEKPETEAVSKEKPEGEANILNSDTKADDKMEPELPEKTQPV